MQYQSVNTPAFHHFSISFFNALTIPSLFFAVFIKVGSTSDYERMVL